MERLDNDLQPELALLSLEDQILIRGASGDTVSELVFECDQTNWYVLVATRFDVDLGTSQGCYWLSYILGLP